MRWVVLAVAVWVAVTAAVLWYASHKWRPQTVADQRADDERQVVYLDAWKLRH